MKKPRRVFGRVTAIIDGKSWIVELRPDGVWVRQFRRREWAKASFSQLLPQCFPIDSLFHPSCTPDKP